MGKFTWYAANENGRICENKDASNSLNSYSSSQLLFATANKTAVKGKEKGRGVKLYRPKFGKACNIDLSTVNYFVFAKFQLEIC